MEMVASSPMAKKAKQQGRRRQPRCDTNEVREQVEYIIKLKESVLAYWQLRRLVVYSATPQTTQDTTCSHCCKPSLPTSSASISPLDESVPWFKRKAVLSILVNTLQLCTRDELSRTKCLVLEVMCNLSQSEENRLLLLGTPKAIDVILDHTHGTSCALCFREGQEDASSMTRTMALRLLNNLATCCEFAEAMVLHHDLMTSLVEILRSASQETRESLLDIFLNIASHSECALLLVEIARFVPTLLAIHTLGSSPNASMSAPMPQTATAIERTKEDSTATTKKVAHLILRLSAASDCREYLLARHPQILSYLLDIEASNSTLQEVAIRTLSNLALAPGNGQILCTHPSSPLAVIVKLITQIDADPVVRVAALKTIRHITSWHVNRPRIYENELVTNAILECARNSSELVVVRTMALACISNFASILGLSQQHLLLPESPITLMLGEILSNEREDENVRDHAIVTVMYLAHSDTNRLVMFNKREIFCSLKSLASTSQQDIQRSLRANAIMALDHLCGNREIILKSLIADRVLFNELIGVASDYTLRDDDQVRDAAEELLGTFGYWRGLVEMNVILVTLCSAQDIPRFKRLNKSPFTSFPKDLMRRLATMIYPASGE